MLRASLDQMLATIPPQGLDRKVSDIHLAEIATALINWREVCTNLGIKQADEVAIEEENKTANVRRFVVVLLQNAGNSVHETCMFQGISCMIHAQVYHCMHGTPHPWVRSGCCHVWTSPKADYFCHHIGDSCRVLKDTEIDWLGEWNSTQLFTLTHYFFYKCRFIHQEVYVFLLDTLSSCHCNSKDAHAKRAYVPCHSYKNGMLSRESRVLNQSTIRSQLEKHYMNNAQPGEKAWIYCTPTPPSHMPSPCKLTLLFAVRWRVEGF